MTDGVLIWYSEEEFSIDFLPLFVFIYITQVMLVILSKKFTLK